MRVEMVKEEWTKQIRQANVMFISEWLLQFSYKCMFIYINIACVQYICLIFLFGWQAFLE